MSHESTIETSRDIELGSVSFKKTPNTSSSLKKILHPIVKEWFYSRFKDFSITQKFGVMEIHSRNNVLISAPTGATKTLTAFLSILNALVDSSEKEILEDRVYAVYVSPLKALSRDVEVNLKEPLQQMEEIAGKKLNIKVAARTGDTTPYERTKMVKNPPHILVTTPESLAILLSTKSFRLLLSNVEWFICDEIHALAENKRGVHLSLTMEMLQRLSPGMCRIGLSATVAPVEKIAHYLVGTKRVCKIIEVKFIKDVDLKVLSPVPDLVNTTYEKLQNKTYELIDKLIQEHKTTLIFTNTRAATERVVHHLREKYPKKYTDVLSKSDDMDFILPEEQNKFKDGSEKVLLPDKETKITGIGAHHGSLSKSHRYKIETNLREGKLRVVVCSTSLELGIDIGFIDLVILLGSPKSVARALQRVGRAGHQLSATTKGRLIVQNRDDLVECSVLLKSAIEKKIDRIHIPTNALDVLAQQIYAIAINERILRKDLLALIRQSYCYHSLTTEDFDELIKYLSGDHISLEDRHIYAKIWYDPETGLIGRKGRMARVIYMTNIGTIPDQTGVTVKVGEYKIGTLDEAFLERLRRGDVFVLGGTTYQFKFSRGMVAQVSAVPGMKPTVPSWFSEMLPLSFDLANAIGRFRRLIDDQFKKKKSKKEILKFINEYLYVDDNAAIALYKYLKEQFDYSIIPSDKKIVIENYSSEDKKYVVFHTLFGRRVNDVLSRAIAHAVARTQHRDVEMGITDNGFYIASKSSKVRPDGQRAFSLLKSERLRELMDIAIDKTQVLVRRFRHCAGRSLMILRNYKGHRKRVGRQQVSSMILMAAIKRISIDFPILKEARREVLEDLMDIDNATKIIKGVENGTIKLESVETSIPSPFAFNIVMLGHLDILRMEDRLEFLKRMHQMIAADISLKKGKKGEKLSAEEKQDMKFNYDEYWKDLEGKAESEKDEFKEKLKFQIMNLSRVPTFAKAELMKIVDGSGYMRPDVIAGIQEHRSTIEKNWPFEVRQLILKFVDEGKKIDLKKFKEELAESDTAKTEKLKRDLEYAARKVDLDAHIRFECERLINGDKEGFKKPFLKWLDELFKGTIPKFWSDELIKFLIKQREEL